MPGVTITVESWPIAGSFTISRGSKTAADVVVVTLTRDGAVGRGECVPYARYGETVPGVVAALEAARTRIAAGVTRADVPALLEPMAARNALDCALWDLEAKLAGKRVWDLAGLPAPGPAITAYTLSLAAPDVMGEAAARAAHRPLLKLKFGGGDEDVARLAAVRAAAPDSTLIVDANEGWSPDDLGRLLEVCATHRVALVEQPLPASGDEALARIARPVPVCADESAHGVGSLERLQGKYDAINIKLDKTGGLTPALALSAAAGAQGFTVMTGCMLATSLAMAPAFLLAAASGFVDLDGPLLLARDRLPGLRYDGSLMYPPAADLWG